MKRMSFVTRRVTAVMLSVAMLLSCMVWTSVGAASAAAYSYTFDVNDIGDTANRASGFYHNSYWNQTSNAPKNTAGSGSYATLVAGGYNGSSHLMQLKYEKNGTDAASTTQQYAMFSLPNNSPAYENGRRTDQTIHLVAGQAYKVSVTYRVPTYVSAMTLQMGVGMGNLADSNSTINSHKLTPVNDLFTITSSAANWVTREAYFTAAIKDGATLVLDMADHTNRAGTVVEIGALSLTPVAEIPKQPDKTYTFIFDDIGSLSGGNGSGKNVVTGAAYDYEGKANGKGAAIKLNQPYTARGTVEHENAGRFQLQNAAGKLNATVGNKYVITARVKSGLTVADDLYWTVGTHSDNAHWNGKHNFEEITFEDTKVTLQPGVWTEITATVESLRGNGTNVNYLSFAAGFAEGKGDSTYLYVDNVTVEEYVPEIMQDVPPATAVVPNGTLLGVQNFEKGALGDFITNTGTKGNFDGVVADTNYTAGGAKALKTTIKDGWNSQRERPRIVVKLGDATTASNLKVEAGKQYTVSFWLKTSKATDSVAFYVATMGAADVNSQIKATSGACHTLQPLSYSNLGIPKKGGADSQWGTANEVAGVSLAAYQWTQIVVTIPSLTLDAAGQDNYLAIGFTCDECQSGNAANWNDTPYYIDDIAVYEVPTTCVVNFNTNGGTAMPSVSGDKNTTVDLSTPVRVGYTFRGWYSDASLTTAVSSPYTLTAEEVTLYAKWEEARPTLNTLVQDFESATSVEQFTTRLDKPFMLTDSGNHTVGGSKALKARVQFDYNRNFNRPLWAFQMGTDTAPLQIVPGTAATVTFSLMASRDVHTVSYMLDTVNDLASLNADAPLSSDADAYRTMQVMSSTSVGVLNEKKNEVNAVGLKKGEWITVTAQIPAIQPHGGGTQYLVLALGDINANIEIEPYDLYVDDVSISYHSGGQSADVIYHTRGGEEIPDGRAIVWTDILLRAEREGYIFDGWYADENCTKPVTVYPPEDPIHLYAGWIPEGVGKMTMELDSGFVPTLYADTVLETEAVQKYYGTTNMYQSSEALHAIKDDGNGGKLLSVTYGSSANTSTIPYGFRLVGEDTAGSGGFSTVRGTVYSVSFKYRVDALPVTTEVRVLEGSINWLGVSFMSRDDHAGFDITPADVGKGWQTGTVNFVSSIGNVGAHLVLHAADYANRAGTVVCFDDIKVQSYKPTSVTTFGDATRVENEQNFTVGGKAAVKLDTAVTTDAGIARVVFAGSLGNQLFAVNTINTATVWLYSETATEAQLKLYSTPDLTAMGSATADHVVGKSPTITLEAGIWTRVQVEFALPDINGEHKSYVALAVSTPAAATVYLDDASIGVYPSDRNKIQTYEELAAGEHPNTARFDGRLHGHFGNTVVSGKGYNGSAQSLAIRMQSDGVADASRAVLFFDKKDATAAVGGSYIVTFYAMVETDTEVTFGLGTSATIDLSDPTKMNLYEDAALTTVSLQAGKWQGVSVVVTDLQGVNPDLTKNPYVTLGAWFKGATAANAVDVYVDNVSLRDYTISGAQREEILCFEEADAFGFGKNLNLSSSGTMEVVTDDNHTENGYYSLKVTSTSGASIAGATRPQFNLTDALGKPVRVKAGEGYRVSFWVKLDGSTLGHAMRFWLTVTEETEAYTAATNALRIEEQVYEVGVYMGSLTEWKQVSVILPPEVITKDGYVRLGICGADPKLTAFYVDDIRVNEHKIFTYTGEESVQDYEKYNIEDKDFIRYGIGYVSDEMNRTEGGGNSLRLEGISEFGYNRNQMIVTDPAGNKPYEFEQGRSYTMTFWMYCASEYTDVFDLNAWLWGTDNPALAFTTADQKNSKNGTFEWDGVVKPVTNDGEFIPDEWNLYTITFTPTNGKYMLMGITDGARSDSGYVYYIDDMEIKVLEPATVIYDANGGAFGESVTLNDKGQFVEDNFIGKLAGGPEIDPYLAGKQLKGWALDKEGKQPFDLTADVIPSATVTLYAVWGNWTNQDGYEQIGSGNKDDGGEDVKYKTEIKYDKVWVENTVIPSLDLGDKLNPEEADPVVRTPDKDTDTHPADGLPVWLIIVIIAAAVLVVGSGAALALVLLKKRRSSDKEVA